METNSDRDYIEKLDLVLALSSSTFLKNSLQNDNAITTSSEIQNYKRTKKLRYCENSKNSNSRNLMILKDRYLLSNVNENGSNNPEYMCLDIDTEEKYLCKVITEPYDKVLRAYFECTSSNNSSILDHQKIRSVKDIIPVSQDRTYLLIAAQNFGNLHTYIRDRRRLQEIEAKILFRQICETVEICHRNGIVLRDLKLRKFFFIDRERKTLEYESLEGSVILNNPEDDKLSDKIGCPLYVAPELITTNSNYGGKAADMWALGVILYTMLIGKYPFNDLNGQTLFTKILTCNLNIPVGLSSKAKCLLRSLLRRQPEERLTVEDIFDHPWFKDIAEHESRSNDFGSDHCVPELSLESEFFELT